MLLVDDVAEGIEPWSEIDGVKRWRRVLSGRPLTVAIARRRLLAAPSAVHLRIQTTSLRRSDTVPFELDCCKITPYNSSHKIHPKAYFCLDHLKKLTLDRLVFFVVPTVLTNCSPKIKSPPAGSIASTISLLTWLWIMTAFWHYSTLLRHKMGKSWRTILFHSNVETFLKAAKSTGAPEILKEENFGTQIWDYIQWNIRSFELLFKLQVVSLLLSMTQFLLKRHVNFWLRRIVRRKNPLHPLQDIT